MSKSLFLNALLVRSPRHHAGCSSDTACYTIYFILHLTPSAANMPALTAGKAPKNRQY